jgi:acetolactate synthase-1/2/3 large subunit
MNPSQVIIQYLVAAGIRHVFGYPGDPAVEFLQAARREGMRFVPGSREGTAGLMAEAYGQLTGRPGVCLSIPGPGSTSLVNAAAYAYLDHRGGPGRGGSNGRSDHSAADARAQRIDRAHEG